MARWKAREAGFELYWELCNFEYRGYSQNFSNGNFAYMSYLQEAKKLKPAKYEERFFIV